MKHDVFNCSRKDLNLPVNCKCSLWSILKLNIFKSHRALKMHFYQFLPKLAMYPNSIVNSK